MQFSKQEASLFIPDGIDESQALPRATHLGVGAHQDDLEILAFQGILECYRKPGKWFAGVTCTNGSGSARTGDYADCSDEDMMAIRREEQNAAATIGQYAFMAQLFFSSKEIKNGADKSPVDDLECILRATRPEVVYTHNPADKHDTHVAVLTSLLEALRRLPSEMRPEKFLGCEVWRDLDWMLDSDKVGLDVGGRDHLAMSLMGLYDSQIAGGKRYDLATMGRRRAHATYAESHAVDAAEQLTFAMDLMPLLKDDSSDPADYVCAAIHRFEEDVRRRLKIRTMA